MSRLDLDPELIESARQRAAEALAEAADLEAQAAAHRARAAALARTWGFVIEQTLTGDPSLL